jgi:hypothetical protein
MGPDGKPQKTQVGAPPPPPSGGRLKKRVIEKKTEELKRYAQQIAGLVQSYVPPNPERMQQAFWQGSAAFSNTGPDAVRVAFTNYDMPGDSVTLVFNTAQKGIQSVEVSSFLNNDPKDAVTFSAQFAKLPDGTNHMANATVNGENEAPNNPDPEYALPDAVKAQARQARRNRRDGPGDRLIKAHPL